VVAAANPIFGQYDPHKDPHKNIALPDSLLSRFDLLFVVTDDIEDTRDRQVSEHVLRMHRYRQAGTEEGAPVREQTSQSLGVSATTRGDLQRLTDVYEKYDAMLHAGVTLTSGRGSNKKPEILSIPFMKKYIQYAKTRIRPILTQEASERIAEIYVGLRNDEMEGNQRRTSPLTVRTLETLIRLSTAHAKSRLSSRVEDRDALAAEGILRFALFKEVIEDQSRKKRRKTQVPDYASSSGESSDNDGDDDDEDASTTRDRSQISHTSGRNTRAATRSRGVPGISKTAKEAFWGSQQNQSTQPEADEEADEEAAASSSARQSARSMGPTNNTGDSQASFGSSIPASQLQSESGDRSSDNELASDAAGLAIDDEPITPQRLATFRTALGQLMNTDLFDDDSAHLIAVCNAVNEKMSARDGGSYSRSEAVKALKKLEEANHIMFADGEFVYKI
jgi:DNA replication licensing factor MCM3